MKKATIGIDIGGTYIRGVIFQSGARNGTPVVAHRIATPKQKSALLADLENLIKKLQSEAVEKGYSLQGIGAGIAGPVDRKLGILTHAPHLPLKARWNALKFFKKFARDVKIDNDSRCFLRAETSLGAGKGFCNSIGVAIGTGIGGGVMIDGKIFYGSHDSAGEFGHMILDGTKTFGKLAERNAFLAHGDRSEQIGIGIANLVNVIDPEIVIIGGGGGLSQNVRLQKIHSVVRKLAVSPAAKNVKIVKGTLGEFAQAIGAALQLY